MPTHKSNDYKLTAVQYYLVEDKTQEDVCKIIKCSPRSLMRWVERYKTDTVQHSHFVDLQTKCKTFLSYLNGTEVLNEETKEVTMNLAGTVAEQWNNIVSSARQSGGVVMEEEKVVQIPCNE